MTKCTTDATPPSEVWSTGVLSLSRLSVRYQDLDFLHVSPLPFNVCFSLTQPPIFSSSDFAFKIKMPHPK